MIPVWTDGKLPSEARHQPTLAPKTQVVICGETRTDLNGQEVTIHGWLEKEQIYQVLFPAGILLRVKPENLVRKTQSSLPPKMEADADSWSLNDAALAAGGHNSNRTPSRRSGGGT